MSAELIDYIFNFYSHLLNSKEKSVFIHHQATLKAANTENTQLRALILGRWGSKDEETLKLLECGYDHFREIVAERILKEHQSDIFINLCPKCHILARTPFAKQCRFCGYDWH